MNKMGIVGIFLNVLKPFTMKPQLSSDIIEKTEIVFAMIRHETRLCFLKMVIQHCFGIPGHSRQETVVRGTLEQWCKATNPPVESVSYS